MRSRTLGPDCAQFFQAADQFSARGFDLQPKRPRRHSQRLLLHQNILPNELTLRVVRDISVRLHPIMHTEKIRIRAQHRLNLHFRPNIECPLSVLVLLVTCYLILVTSRRLQRRIRILRRIKSSVRSGQIALHIVKNPARQPRIDFVSGRLLRLQIVERDLRLIVEHLFKMRHKPPLIDRVAMKPATHMIVQSALRHLLQRVRGQLHRHGAQLGRHALQGCAAEEQIDHRRARKFRRPAKPAPRCIMRLMAILEAFFKRLACRFMKRNSDDSPSRNFARRPFRGITL